MNQFLTLPVLLQLALICVSLVLWIQAVSSWLSGQSWMKPLGYPRFEVQPGINFAGFILGFLIFPAAIQKSLGDDPDQEVYRIQMHNLFRCIFVILWICVQRIPLVRLPAPNREASPPLHLSHSVRIGLWGFFFSFLPVWLLLMAVEDYHEDHRLIHLLREHPSAELWTTVVVTAVIVAPLFEELLFRVMLLPSLRELLDPWRAIFISSAIFAISHSPVDAIPLFPLALVLGYIYHRTGSYAAVIAMHGMFNAFNLYLFWSQQQLS